MTLLEERIWTVLWTLSVGILMLEVLAAVSLATYALIGSPK